MRHHPEHVTVKIAYPGDVGACTVRIGFLSYFTRFVAVPEHDLAVLFERLERHVVTDVIPFGMSNRYRKHAAFFELSCERCFVVLDADVHVAADEIEAGVSDQSTGQQTSFAQDLKAVADSEYELPFRSE